LPEEALSVVDGAPVVPLISHEASFVIEGQAISLRVPAKTAVAYKVAAIKAK
jgi:hypothetical protein